MNINITPLEILHAIGQATTPNLLPKNLVDISSTWAVIRYLWAFDIQSSSATGRLRLSDEARRIDFHQKTLLSDEVGVGMATYIMNNFMGTTNLIDVDIALRTSIWERTLERRGPTSPDYLFYDDSFNDLYIVECKGNQTSRHSSIDQLRRGTKQLIPTTDGVIVEIFQGLKKELIDSYITNNQEKAAMELRSINQKIHQNTNRSDIDKPSGYLLSKSEHDYGVTFKSCAADGTIYQISVSESAQGFNYGGLG